MKRTIAAIIVFFFALSVFSVSFAEDKPVKDAAKYTGGVVTGSVNTVGEAAKGTTETAVSPFVALWRSMTGKGKPEKIVTDPVEKGGKTVYDATVNTGKTVAGEKK